MGNNVHLKSFFSFTLLIVCLGMIFSCSATRHSQNSILHTTDPMYEEIETLGNELTVKNNVPGVAVAVIRDGKVAWIQSIGYADLASKKPVTSETIFNIGSISKLVSSWGFMQLTEKGFIKLDDPVDQYLTRWHLPESEFDRSKVTLRRILSHTAGLSVHGYGGSDQGIPLLSLEESLNGKQNGMVKPYILSASRELNGTIPGEATLLHNCSWKRERTRVLPPI